MSLIEVVAAIVPPDSDEDRMQARAKARASAGTGWLSQILDHHQQIEQAFEAVMVRAAGYRLAAQGGAT